MAGLGSGQCSNGGERKLQIVSGKGFGVGFNNQTYSARPSPAPKIPATVNGGTNRVGSSWGIGDPEMKRKKRVAKYKVYSVEGKVKASLRNGLRWIKFKCSQIIHGS